jgi:hypothetical protein
VAVAALQGIPRADNFPIDAAGNFAQRFGDAGLTSASMGLLGLI